MKYLLLMAAFCLVALVPRLSFAGDVSPFQECGTLVNSAGQQVMGVVKTESYMFRGQILRHEKNFNLQDGETVEVCSTGPFFSGYKVELTIRTIMPLFTCQTRLSGNIYLRKKWDDENGVNVLYADCK